MGFRGFSGPRHCPTCILALKFLHVGAHEIRSKPAGLVGKNPSEPAWRSHSRLALDNDGCLKVVAKLRLDLGESVSANQFGPGALLQTDAASRIGQVGSAAVAGKVCTADWWLVMYMNPWPRRLCQAAALDAYRARTWLITAGAAMISAARSACNDGAMKTKPEKAIRIRNTGPIGASQ